MSTTRTDQILDFAEHQMRKGGYDAVSFRDIASAIGIKSASVHYHFPTKADLGRAVTERYTQRFIDSLGDPSKGSEADRLARLTEAYRAAFAKDGSVCLCAVLGATAAQLPAKTSDEVRVFYDQLLSWSDQAFQSTPRGLSPSLIIAMLQGAMVLALASGERAALDEAIAFLTATD